MREAARETLRFLEGVEYIQFIRDRRIRLAVERELEILGEAARRVSLEFQASHPEVPWRDIVGQCNVLAHEYGTIDTKLVWDVATQDLPVLIPILDALIPPIPDC